MPLLQTSLIPSALTIRDFSTYLGEAFITELEEKLRLSCTTQDTA